MWLPTTDKSYLGRTLHFAWTPSNILFSKLFRMLLLNSLFSLPHPFCLYNSQFIFSLGIKSQLLFRSRKTYITLPSLSLAKCMFTFFLLSHSSQWYREGHVQLHIRMFSAVCTYLSTFMDGVRFTLYHIAIVTVYFPPGNLSACTSGSRFCVFSIPTPFQGQIWALWCASFSNALLFSQFFSAEFVASMEGSALRPILCCAGSKIRGGAPWRILCLHLSLPRMFKSLEANQLTFHSNTHYTFAWFLNVFLGFFFLTCIWSTDSKKHAMSFYVCEDISWWCYKSGLWKTKIVIISWAYDDLELYNMPIIIRSVQFCHSFLAPEKLNIGQMLYLYFTWWRRETDFICNMLRLTF